MTSESSQSMSMMPNNINSPKFSFLGNDKQMRSNVATQILQLTSPSHLTSRNGSPVGSKKSTARRVTNYNLMIPPIAQTTQLQPRENVKSQFS